MSYQDIFGLSTDSDASFEGFNSVTEMTKTKKASSGKQPQKQSGAGFFFLSKSQPNQELKEPHRKMAAMPMVGLTDQHLDLILLFLRFT